MSSIVTTHTGFRGGWLLEDGTGGGRGARQPGGSRIGRGFEPFGGSA